MTNIYLDCNYECVIFEILREKVCILIQESIGRTMSESLNLFLFGFCYSYLFKILKKELFLHGSCLSYFIGL